MGDGPICLTDAGDGLADLRQSLGSIAQVSTTSPGTRRRIEERGGTSKNVERVVPVWSHGSPAAVV